MVPRMDGWFPDPPNASQRRVATGPLTMNIVGAGSGPAVLLIHGLGRDHSLWSPTLERFTPRCRLIAAHTRGHRWHWLFWRHLRYSVPSFSAAPKGAPDFMVSALTVAKDAQDLTLCGSKRCHGSALCAGRLNRETSLFRQQEREISS
jgi:pimeloyl-ACP methyl ester carboxylesterase